MVSGSDDKNAMKNWVILTSVLVKNPIKESFYGEKKNNKCFDSFFHFP